MMKHTRYILLLCMVSFLISMAAGLSSPAFADERASEIGECRSKHEGTLLAVIVPCVRDIIIEACERMTDEFDDFLQRPMLAFMALVITIFGVKLLANAVDPKREGFLLLMKIGLVLLFMDNFGGYIPAVFGTIQETVEIVTTSLEGSLNNLQCDTSSYEGEKPWSLFDCVLGELFGFAPQALVGSSIFGLMGTALWSGEFGASMFLGTLAVVTLVFRFIIRATYIYLMALTVVAFLIVISPLFIPLALMREAVFTYFEQWLRGLIAAALQPMIVMAFLTLSFGLMDKIMYHDELGIAKLLPKEEIAKLWNSRQGFNTAGMAGDACESQAKIDGHCKALEGKKHRDIFNGLLTGTTDTNLLGQLYTFNFRSDEANKGQKVVFAMLALAVVAWVLTLMMEQIMQIAGMMLGSNLVSAAVGEGSPLEQGMKQMTSPQATQGLGKALNTGKNLVKGLTKK